MVSQVERFPFMAKYYLYTFICVYICVCVYPFIYHWTCGLPSFLGYLNNTAVNMWVHITFKRFFFSPEVEFLDHMVVLFFNFLRKSHNFSRVAENLHSHQECIRITFSPLPHQYLLFLVFLIIAILTGVK